jgi:drug/metabolite transporter (DMT)-like permease
VTLVAALSSVQPFFVLLIAVVLSVFYPKILKEEIGKSAVLLKAVAILVMFAGAVLIT